MPRVSEAALRELTLRDEQRLRRQARLSAHGREHPPLPAGNPGSAGPRSGQDRGEEFRFLQPERLPRLAVPRAGAAADPARDHAVPGRERPRFHRVQPVLRRRGTICGEIPARPSPDRSRVLGRVRAGKSAMLHEHVSILGSEAAGAFVGRPFGFKRGEGRSTGSLHWPDPKQDVEQDQQPQQNAQTGHR